MKVSFKKENEVYKVVSDCIFDARIEIAKLQPGSKLLEKVDEILYRLGIDCPKEAIHTLKNKTQ